MNSIYFVKEKNYKLIIELNSIENERKTSGAPDPIFITGDIDIYLDEDSFSSPKYIGGKSNVYTYLQTAYPSDNPTTKLNITHNKQTIFITTIWGYRIKGEAPGTYDLTIYAEKENSKTELKGFVIANDEQVYPAKTGILTINAKPATPEDPDDPKPLTPELSYNNISVTVTDEEWEWLKGLANE